MSRISPSSHTSDDDRQAYNNRDSYITTTSITTDSTENSNSTYTTTYTGTTTTRDSSSRRNSDRRTSSYSSVVQAEILDLENMIYKVKEQLDFHKRRADTEERRANDAERKLQEYAEHLAKVNKARIVAQQEANRANEELRLYKLQLQYAQREINRAQTVLDQVDKQRYDAEKQASEAKAKARKLNEELIVENARREGRRQGLQEGLDRGRDLILQETEGDARTRRRPVSTIDRVSFMSDGFGSESSDTRTISTESHITLQADRRPRQRPLSYAPRESTSPPPLPVPAPAVAPRPESRVPSAAQQYAASIAPSLSYERPRSGDSSIIHERPRSRAASVVQERPRSRAASVIQDRPPSRAASAVQERPRSRASSIATERPPSRAPSVAHYSRVPSVAHSRTPSVAGYEQPYQAPSNAYPESRPVSAQGYSPLPRPSVAIPPDNLIPTLEMDGVIRLPPPHGFHKQPLTPEQPPSPSLPPQHHYDTRPPIPPVHRQSSPESASTTLSHLEILKGPSSAYNAHNIAVTPALSTVEEVSSAQASPYPPSGYDIRHRSSMAESSVGGGGSISGSPNVGYNQGSQVGIHHRNRSTSSFVPSIHERPPSVKSRSSKKGSTAQGTPIQISVQPPSRPVSDGTQSISKSQLSPLPHDSVPFSPSFSAQNSVVSPAGSSAKPMPGSMYDNNAYHGMAPSPMQSAKGAKDDDAVSSRISGEDDFFTTPPPSGAPRSFKPAESVISAASVKTSKTSKSRASKSSRNR